MRQSGATRRHLNKRIELLRNSFPEFRMTSEGTLKQVTFILPPDYPAVIKKLLFSGMSPFVDGGVQTLDRAYLHRKLGTLPRQLLRRVGRRVRLVLEVNESYGGLYEANEDNRPVQD